MIFYKSPTVEHFDEGTKVDEQSVIRIIHFYMIFYKSPTVGHFDEDTKIDQ